MSKTITDLKVKTCKAQAGDKLRARATIGDAQKGGWSLLVNNQQIDSGTTGKWVALGVADDLFGKAMEVSAVIIDIRPETDRLSLTVEVEGGTATTVSISHAGDAGDRAAYSVIVPFAKKGA